MSAHSRMFSTAVFTAALMVASGCVCVTQPTGRSGDLTFTWHFNGSDSCSQVFDVDSIAIVIPGQTLQNGGVFNCRTAGTDGITLENFRPGTYQYTISARDVNGRTLYERAGSVTVNGGVAVDVDLLPVAGAGAKLNLAWAFPNGSPVNCSVTTSVDLSINGVFSQSYACSAGLYPSSIFVNVPAGSSVIAIDARDSNSFFYYHADMNLQVAAGGMSAQTLTFNWSVGSLALRWSFSNGVTQLDCAQAGISTLNVNLRDSQGTLVYGTQGYDVGCRNNDGVQGVQFPYLYGGTYELFVQGYGTGQVLYRSNWTQAPLGTVVNGQFPNVDQPTLTVLATPQ